jgi:hypothetical protein
VRALISTSKVAYEVLQTYRAGLKQIGQGLCLGAHIFFVIFLVLRHIILGLCCILVVRLLSCGSWTVGEWRGGRCRTLVRLTFCGVIGQGRHWSRGHSEDTAAPVPGNTTPSAEFLRTLLQWKGNFCFSGFTTPSGLRNKKMFDQEEPRHHTNRPEQT